jgi:hypothetical protein
VLTSQGDEGNKNTTIVSKVTNVFCDNTTLDHCDSKPLLINNNEVTAVRSIIIEMKIKIKIIGITIIETKIAIGVITRVRIKIRITSVIIII